MINNNELKSRFIAFAIVATIIYFTGQNCYIFTGESIIHKVSCQIASHNLEKPEFKISGASTTTHTSSLSYSISSGTSVSTTTILPSPSPAFEG